MTPNTDSNQYVEQVAGDVLAKFEKTSSTAKSKLDALASLTPAALAAGNTFNTPETTHNLNEIYRQNRASYEMLAMEPAIARVVTEDEHGERQTYYFCRGEQGIPELMVISYRAPIGRLASLPVGEDFLKPNGDTLSVLERTLLHPNATSSGWDSINNRIEAENFGPVTIESLREVLVKATGVEVPENLLEQIWADEMAKANIIEGVRRIVITKMELRDQPVLDQFQDEIFRLPLNKRLLILGPAGTGKTTTLIRRLGQKLDTAFLEEDESRVVETVYKEQGVMHTKSWLLFTPTELLQQYLKEAFAREGVPASDRRIRTWHDYQRELGRNTLSVLRTASGRGPFILKDDLQGLRPEATEDPIQWFKDFDTWQRSEYIRELREASSLLNQVDDPEVSGPTERIEAILSGAGESLSVSAFEALAKEHPNMQKLLVKLKEATDAKIKSALKLQLNNNKTFLDEMAQFIDSLKQTQVADLDEQDGLDADEEEELSSLRTGPGAAINAYMQAVRAQARTYAAKRSLSTTSRYGKIIEWLDDRALAEADRAEVGASLLVQTNIRRFVNPLKRFLDGIPKRYRKFRSLDQAVGKWYRNQSLEAKNICPLELDLILLAILRSAADLSSSPSIQRDIDNPAWSSLKPIVDNYCNQILVDEATDFSPIQLACMAALANPRLRSFCACGDFNQRLTTWGTRSVEEIKWVFKDLDIKKITVSYRQSKQLNELARALVRAVGGTGESAILPVHVNSDGVAPALLENSGDEVMVRWLAARIREIDGFMGQLPSTAIFVNSEEEVEFIAEALNAELSEHNIQVIACREGQAVGQESNVRVFNIQHIKGLEFEAVFFTKVDRLAKLHPDLFDKYLYVGMTRAATYLGLTCEGKLPPAIESLRSLFEKEW